jgi:hypothetical protein
MFGFFPDRAQCVFAKKTQRLGALDVPRSELPVTASWPSPVSRTVGSAAHPASSKIIQYLTVHPLF